MSHETPFELPNPEQVKGPSTNKDACWIGWKIADARAQSLAEEKDRLQRELGAVREKNAMLNERVGSLRKAQTTSATFNTVLVALAGITGSSLVASARKSDSPLSGETLIWAMITAIFLMLVVIISWFTRGSTSIKEPKDSICFTGRDEAA
jgi:hypothetical protein